MTSCVPCVVNESVAAALSARSGPRRALFLDRDGVINVDHGYVHSPAKVDWIPGIFELVADASARGWLCIVVTNQAGIARGFYNPDTFLGFTQWIHEQFLCRGAPLLATYWCPHHPDTPAGPCPCRKPSPGMLLAAMDDWGISASDSWLVGDNATDIQAAQAAGIGRAWDVGPSGVALSEVRHALSMNAATGLPGASV